MTPTELLPHEAK